MNRQSDHGYETSPDEFRSRELCERRALQCEALAGRYPAEGEKYRQWAAEWRKELKTAPAS